MRMRKGVGLVHCSAYSTQSLQEREKDIKSVSGGGVNWCDFMSGLSKLAQAEAAYYNLSFVEKSWRRRKEVCILLHCSP